MVETSQMADILKGEQILELKERQKNLGEVGLELRTSLTPSPIKCFAFCVVLSQLHTPKS